MRTASLRIATLLLLIVAALIGLWLLFYPKGYWIAGEYGLSWTATVLAALSLVAMEWLARRFDRWWLDDIARWLVVIGAASALILAGAPLWFNFVAPPSGKPGELMALDRLGFVYRVVFTFLEVAIAGLLAGWGTWLVSRILRDLWRIGRPS